MQNEKSKVKTLKKLQVMGLGNKSFSLDFAIWIFKFAMGYCLKTQGVE